MQMRVSKVVTGPYSVREDFNEEHVREIAESFEREGQWNPIIVTPRDNGADEYELISGHYRLRAAKEIGWDSIEATVKDIEEDEADLLSLKTNMMRQGMEQREQGEVIVQMMNEHELSQAEIADRLSRSEDWVHRRVRLALDLHEDVINALNDGEISNTIASIAGRIDENQQPAFVRYVKNRDVSSQPEAREARRRLVNDTIYTIGYEGRDWESFASVLSNNDVDVLVDVRGSAESQYKPEFNGDVMADRLGDAGIDYIHRSELGVDYLVRSPYKDGWIGDDCFESWYQWWIQEEADIELADFVAELEDIGTPALMCIEQYPKPMRDQKIYCHRHFLADMIRRIRENENQEFVFADEQATLSGRQVFPERVDI
jgi:ParB family chromosome partitioning protein